MAGAIEALYIYDSQNAVILQHNWRHRPTASAQEYITSYLSHPTPRPPLIHLSNLSPPTLLFSIIHNNLTFLSPATSEVEPLLTLEFLHRIAEVLEDYFTPPLIPSKIEGNYDVVAELLGEMCDDGLPFNTEPNGLRDVVLPPSIMKKLLANVTLPTGSLDPFRSNPSTISTIPWRRANVKHTSNEMYLDLLETLHCTVAPSGRPISARVAGTMLFTAKISGIPDMLLLLRTPTPRGGGGVTLEAPVFHPCVRLSKWNSQPGHLSFVPPDGKFVLASYEVNMLPDFSPSISAPQPFHLPLSVTTKTLQGPNSTEFEVKVIIPHSSPYASSTTSSSSSQNTGSSAFARIAAQSAGTSIPSQFLQGPSSSAGSSNNPVMEDVAIHIPLPPQVRTLINTRASKGDFIHDTEKNQIRWRLPNAAITPGATYTFKAEVVVKSTYEEEEADEEVVSGAKLSNYDNNYDAGTPKLILNSGATTPAKEKEKEKKLPPSAQVIASMPRSVLLDFTIRGALLSGLKVDSLNIVGGKGLPESVKPYKGVKYISRAGEGSVEVRC
ncbi:hypothetical protein TWF225_001081 [Orbilia oligospora]|nr:hypothetical protein TWF225_001081 [Orbilia oligospora]KAF3256643.1 hypothetical protein TWF217_006330 [Orbilia oligospora]KAF3268749.1 hypothetical protein TWF128_007115 [Orbilia oligospora]KAF3297363.1 hypothetical protein TWF132_007461 [Orbilia oligospora]